MVIFIIVGMPASGKNIARDYAESEHIPYFATGDLVRAEIKNRGLDPTPENTGRVSTEIRGKEGVGVTRLALETALRSGHPAVFLEGMRSWPEIELIRQEAEGVLIALIAPKRIRSDRVASRGRSDDSQSQLDERDSREIQYGAAVPIALADEYILNVGPMEETTAALHRIVKKYR